MRALLLLLLLAAAARAAPCDDGYRDAAAMEAALEALAADCGAAAAAVFSIGESGEGAALTGVEVWAPNATASRAAEVRFIANMHGDEVAGREVLLALAQTLCDSYGADEDVTALLDGGARLFILPSMNPDGFALGQRNNAGGADLNRDFPDQFVDAVDSTAGRQPETAAVMQWTAERDFVLAANLHGGAFLASYGWDGTASGASVYSASPDDALLVHLAETFVDAHPSMTAVTNGADWYSIYGGMQDYGYVWHGLVETTLEISTDKCPAASSADGYAAANVPALLAYARVALAGIEGVVSVSSGSASASASAGAVSVSVVGTGFAVPCADSDGFFRRLVAPGNYSVAFVASSSPSEVLLTVDGVEVDGETAAWLEVELNGTALSSSCSVSVSTWVAAWACVVVVLWVR